MVNKRFLETAERWKNKDLPSERTQKARPSVRPASARAVAFPNLPSESFIFSYDGPHGDYFQGLIVNSNENFRGTRAEIPAGDSGEVTNMHAVKRMALISTIAKNPSFIGHNLLPITPMQSESLLKEGRLPDPSRYWEDLALLLYDTDGVNQGEAIALKEDIVRHRAELGLSQDDLERRLVIVNPGAEPDQSMNYGVKPVIVPGITLVYPHEILDRTGENHSFDYGLDKGLPSVNQIGQGNRTLYMPSGNDIGLRVLFRGRVLNLGARDGDLASSDEYGRVNFAPQGQRP
jgi:hypothetical protein